MPSSTVEDYLKRLYLEQHAPGQTGTVATGRLATAMQVTPGSATSMVKALASAGLVSHEARRGVELTPEGERLALHVLRRHRLLEQFLVEVLGMDWAVVHEEAEMLEHAVSERVLERIDAVLRHPAVDPHGDPIPREGDHIERHQGVSLADCLSETSYRVSRIVDQDPAFLHFLESKGLVPGAVLSVSERVASAGAVQVRVAAGEVSLGFPAAANILLDQPEPGQN